MITKRELFDEVYFFEEPEKLSDKQMENLLVAGRKNHDLYFLPFKTKRPVEIFKKVELLEFEQDADVFTYIKRLKPEQLINFSLEHEKPCVLKFRS